MPLPVVLPPPPNPEPDEVAHPTATAAPVPTSQPTTSSGFVAKRADFLLAAAMVVPPALAIGPVAER
jgi:hypothetical protein